MMQREEIGGERMKTRNQNTSRTNQSMKGKNKNRPQTTIKLSREGGQMNWNVNESTKLSKTTNTNSIEEKINDRCFISTSSTMFFEHDKSINIGKMVAIPISPMYSESSNPVNWDSEFFARGATSLPGARNEMRYESTLPGLNTSRNNKTQTRQLFTRQSSVNSPTPTELDVSPRSHPTSRGLLLTTLPTSSSPTSSMIEELVGASGGGEVAKSAASASLTKDSDIEPWAYKIIAKYHTESTRRPQSRCTTRLRGDGDTLIGPPLGLGEMTQSKSCPEFKRTGKLASLSL